MKTCFKCGVEKELDEFYPHPRMADGHLNKCKKCNKKDTAERVERKMLDPDWVEKEMERHRIKQATARINGTAVVLIGDKKAAVAKRHALKYPEKHAARLTVNNAVRYGRLIKKPCEVCFSPDSEAHHEDYSKPLDVIWYCPKHHAERHVEIRRLKRAERVRNLTLV